MPVLLSRRAPGSPEISRQAVLRMANSMLSYLDLERSELSILLANDQLIRRINREHRDKDRTTDVLSFPQNEFTRPLVVEGGGGGLGLLGDVIISLDTAQRQAASRKRPLLEEVRFLLAHGLLHLLGYDHDTAEKKKEMSRETRRLVRACQ